MGGYTFKTSDLEACSEYPSAVLVCSPSGCIVSGTSEDLVMLYETSIVPLVYGDSEVTINIDSWWELIENYNILQVDQDTLIFDGEYYTNFKTGEHLESKLPKYEYVTKFPQKLCEYSGKVVIHRNGNKLMVRLKDTGVTMVMPYLYSNSDEEFSVAIHSEFLKEYVNGEYLKMYFETDFPICIDDHPHRIYIAPCKED